MRFAWVEAEGLFIAQSARPRWPPELALDLQEARARGVDLLVSCQTEAEAARMGLLEEPEAAEAAGMAFLRHPIVDHSLPEDPAATVAFADRLVTELRAGRRILVHCFAGIGRSGLVVVSALIRAGLSPEEAIRRASLARGLPVPETAAQVRWVLAVPPAQRS